MCEGVGFIWLRVVTVMNHLVPWKVGDFLVERPPISHVLLGDSKLACSTHNPTADALQPALSSRKRNRPAHTASEGTPYLEQATGMAILKAHN